MAEARTAEEIRDEIASVRCAMAAMRSSSESSVGLRNAIDLGGRVEQGMRPTYAQLQEHLKALEEELAAALLATRGRVFRTVYSKGL